MSALKKNIIVGILILIIIPHFLFAQGKTVKIINVVSPITPVSAEFIKKAIEQSEDDNAELLIIQLDTPGGLSSSMRAIIKEILSSRVPVAVYVAPSGAQSGSAGVFINYSAHISAMSPGTNIGAAHPVSIGLGQDTSSVMQDKVLNDATAYIRSLAQQRNRNADWAELAVRESKSITATEALELNVIDLIANNVDDLLEKLNGREIELESGKVVLDTENPRIEEIELGFRLTVLGIIADPNIAYILMLLGLAGIGLELYNPGTFVPGIVGSISLILSFYAFQTLPVNFAGFLLILVAIVLFILEIKVISYGLLSIGGVICMLLGSLMLIDTSLPFLKVSLDVIIPAVILTALFFLTAIGFAIKAQRRKPTTGKEGLVGEKGIAQNNIKSAGEGNILVHGELWKAISEEAVKKGDKVRVISVNELTVTIKKV